MSDPKPVPVKGHWDIEDSGHERRGEIRKCIAFPQALRFMESRFKAFAALPVNFPERSTLTAKMREIGHFEGAAPPRRDVA